MSYLNSTIAHAEKKFGNEMNQKKIKDIWYCKELWSGDSRDGHFTNGDGYHYFQMQSDGLILKAFEFYETDEGEEKVTELPDLVGINWFSFFGYEDDELLEHVPEHVFALVESQSRKKE